MRRANVSAPKSCVYVAIRDVIVVFVTMIPDTNMICHTFSKPNILQIRTLAMPKNNKAMMPAVQGNVTKLLVIYLYNTTPNRPN